MNSLLKNAYYHRWLERASEDILVLVFGYVEPSRYRFRSLVTVCLFYLVYEESLVYE